MRKMTIVIAALAVIALPAAGAAAAPGGKGLAKSACKSERKEMGNKAFKNLYGKRATKSCRGAAAKTAVSAAQDCRSERASLGRDDFDALYGTNHSQRNSTGKCVSAKVRDSIDPDCGTADDSDGSSHGKGEKGQNGLQGGEDSADRNAADDETEVGDDSDTATDDDADEVDADADSDADAGDDDGCEVPDNDGDGDVDSDDLEGTDSNS